jgi:hypothetical protein
MLALGFNSQLNIFIGKLRIVGRIFGYLSKILKSFVFLYSLSNLKSVSTKHVDGKYTIYPFNSFFHAFFIFFWKSSDKSTLIPNNGKMKIVSRISDLVFGIS